MTLVLTEKVTAVQAVDPNRYRVAFEGGGRVAVLLLTRKAAVDLVSGLRALLEPGESAGKGGGAGA